jgi:colanic acid biosynthesis glycosyl transferase WcaI
VPAADPRCTTDKMSMSRKRILVLGVNYFPEPIGIPRYTTEMAEDMAGSGHAVTVIAAAPLYPTWTRQADYSYRWYSREIRNGVTVWRVPTYVPRNTGFLHRTLYELVFFMFSLPLVIGFLLRGADALVVTAQPLALCANMLLLPFGKTRKAVVIKDMQIEIAENMGMIRSRGVLNLLYRVERFLLNRADLVTCVSQGMLNKILRKGLTRPQLALFPDWVDTDRLVRTTQDIAVAKRQQLGLPLDKIVVGYSGNLARKQGIELLVEMAARFRDRGRSDVQFFICGDGPAKAGLAELIATQRLDVVMAPLQPEADLPAMLTAIDVHVVTQKNEVSDLVLPSKMFNIMSCGGAQVITAPDGSGIANVMTQSGAGLRVRREDKVGLEQAILRLCDSAPLRQEIGAHGRTYVLTAMLKRAILDKFYAQLFPKASI